MKKFFILGLTVCALLVLPSCADTQYHELSYQRYPISITGTLEKEDLKCGVTVTVTAANTGEITIDSPESLSGYRFRVENGSVLVFYEDIEIELVPDSVKGICRIVGMLSLEGKEASSIDLEENDSGSFSRRKFNFEDSQITVYTKTGENLPCRIVSEAGGSEIVLNIDTLILQ